MDNEKVSVLLVFNGPGIKRKWQLEDVLEHLQQQTDNEEVKKRKRSE